MALSTKLRNLLNIALPDRKLYKELADTIDANTAGVASNAIDLVKHVDVTLTAAQVKALNGTPISLLAAPGSKLANVLLGAYAYLTYGTATYAGANTLDIRYTNGSGALAAQLPNGFVVSAASAQEMVPPQATCAVVSNAALVAYVPTADFTTGDSTITIRLFYRTVPTA